MKRAALLLLLAALALPAEASAGSLERAGMTNLATATPGAELDLRYATKRNFTRAVLPGYCRPLAYLRAPASRALARVQRDVRRRGYTLRVFDAYRPARATRAMVRWAERTGRNWVIAQGYVARRSNHNRGAAVDLTLVRDGRALDMGTRYDAFTTRSHTLNASGAVLRNRLKLKRAMERSGFRNYRREWWHFDYPPLTGAAALDIALGC